MTQFAANPNTAKPKLALLGKKPIALEAFRARIKLVEPVAVAMPEPVLPTATEQPVVLPSKNAGSIPKPNKLPDLPQRFALIEGA